MVSVKSFIELPMLTRLRWVAGLGAAALGSSFIARTLLGLIPGDAFYPLELASAISFLTFAAFADKFSLIRNNPQASFFFILLPALPHFLMLNFQRHIDVGPLMAIGVCIVFIGIMFESNTWRRNQVVLWTLATLAMVWTVDTPTTSPISISLVFITVAILVMSVGAGYHTALQETARAARLLDESQAFSGVGAWQRDLVTGSLRWSQTTYDILEIDRSDGVNLDFSDFLVDPPDQSKLYEAMQRLATTGEAFDTTDRIRTGTGRVIWIRSQGRADMVRGEPSRLLGVFTDITQQVDYERELTEAKEAAEQAAVSRAQFLANMSHEIRTPMNGVIGMTSLLAQLDLDEQSRRHVDIIRTSGESLLKIINDILDFSKLEAGKLQLESLPINLHKLVQDAVDVVEPSAIDKDLKLVVSMPSDNKFDYLTDETRLRQVLLNLLSNAIKFTEQGSVTVSVDIADQDASVADITIAVSDTGVGIAQDKQPGLFEAFTQADASTTREFGGTGLGLSICQQLVTQMGGHISVVSTPGAGAKFEFIIQLARSPRIEALVDEVIQASHIGQDLRILLAEDNSVNQKVAVMMLDKLGYHADVANNGVEALRAAQENEYDIIFMDLQMPDMDGLSATEEIRRTATHQPQIIALTANAMAEDKARCFDAGMDDFVSKPMRLKDLQGALEAAQSR